MKVTPSRDLLSGLMFTVVGISFAVGASNFDVGNAARMGPGYFPLLLGILLALLGSVIAFQAVKAGVEDPPSAIAWRPLLFILGANLAFGVLLVGVPALGIPHFGMIVAIYALVVIAGYARANNSLKESLVLATILAIGSYGAFVYALNLQFPVLPWFLGH